jgi:hypothetical protein
MGTRRLLTSLLVLASLALGGAGCGSGSGSGSAFGEAAKAVPSGAIAYVDVNIDRDSNAWRNLQNLGSRFQSWDSMVTEFKSGLYDGKDGQAFKRIEKALGSEAAVAVTTIGDGSGDPTVVAYLASKDDGVLRDEASRDGNTTTLEGYKGYDLYKTTDSSAGFIAIGKGAALFSNDQDQLKAAIDAREGDADSLADDPGFQSAEEDFSQDALANVWIDTHKVASIASLGALGGAGSDPAAAQNLKLFADRLKDTDSITASVEARDDGFAVFSTAHGPGVADLAFNSSLLDRVPGTALAFLTTKDIGPALENAIAADPTAAAPVRQFERETGISFHEELVPLLTGEHLLYLGPGVPVGGAIVLKPADVQHGAETMRKLTHYLVSQAGGATVRQLSNGEQLTAAGFTLTWYVNGDSIVVSTDSSGGKRADEPITDSSKLRDLMSKAGAPDDASTLFYVDTPGLLGLIPSSASMGPEAKAIGSMVVWQERGSDVARTGFFLEIRTSGSAS